MRIRVSFLMLVAFAAMTLAPARALPLPLLTCHWSGSVHIDSDWSWEALIWNLGSGTGSCTGDGGGPYDVIITNSYGELDDVNDYSFTVTYKLQSRANGSVQSI